MEKERENPTSLAEGSGPAEPSSAGRSSFWAGLNTFLPEPAEHSEPHEAVAEPAEPGGTT